MSAERMERIRQFRLKQSQAELDRKANKSAERAKLWTQEELDAATAWAKEMALYLQGSA
jgi:hypothetical protein